MAKKNPNSRFVNRPNPQIQSVGDLFKPSSVSKLDPVTSLPMKVGANNSGPQSAGDVLDGIYLPPSRSSHLKPNYISDYNPYNLQRVKWDVSDPSQIDQIRGANQHWSGQMLAFLNQALLGEVVGGTIEGIGATFDLINGGVQDTYGNFMTEFGKDIREWTQEISPIFKTNPHKDWDPMDSGWWYQGMVSVASTLSLLIPAAGWVRGIGMAGRLIGGAGKALRTVNATGRTSKIARGAKLPLREKVGRFMEKVPHAGGRLGQRAGQMVVGGTAMRYMENYREAAETGNISFDRTLAFFNENPENLQNFLNSREGRAFMQQTGTAIDDPQIAQKAAQYVASHAASRSFKLNWTNLAFDILQYGFVMGHLGKLGRGTRASFITPHANKVKKVQNALLKKPKIPTTRMGKIGKFLTPGWKTGYVALGLTEGVEEMVNWVSMQEGLRHGDMMIGNIGIDNGELPHHLKSLSQRLEAYSQQGGFSAGAVFGTIGGLGFGGFNMIVNRKSRQAYYEAQIAEIGKRMSFLQTALAKRQAALDAGNEIAAEEQNKLIALNLGLNASQVGTVDLLIEMMNDPVMDELLEANGMAKEDISKYKDQLIKDIKKAENQFRKYYNRITGTKFSNAAARAVAELSTSVDLYSDLMKQIDDKIQSNTESGTYAEEKANIGANTKARRDIAIKLQGIKNAIEKMDKIIQGITQANADPNTSTSEKAKNKETIEHFELLRAAAIKDQKEAEEKSANLKKDSEETYDAEKLAKEEAYITEMLQADLISLAEQKEMYRSNRDFAWKQLNRLLKGELEITTEKKSDKVEDALLTPEQKKEKIRIEELEKREIEKARDAISKKNQEDAEVSAALQDLRIELAKEGTTQQTIDNFLDQWQHMPAVLEGAKSIIEQWKARKDYEARESQFTSLKEKIKLIEDSIRKGEKSTAALQKAAAEALHLIDQLFASTKENEKLTLKKLKGFLGRYIYGHAPSLLWPWETLFDQMTPVVSAMWKNEQGSLSLTEDKKLIFIDKTGKETLISTSPGEILFNLDLIVSRNQIYNVEALSDGRTISIEGEYFSNLHANPTNAIVYSATGDVNYVVLTKWDGTRVKITNPGYKHDLANFIELLEAVKRSLWTNTTIKMMYRGKEYEFSYRKVRKGRTTSYELVSKLPNKEPRVVRKKEVLDRINKVMSKQIQDKINQLKQNFNEGIRTNNAIASKITEEVLGPESNRSTEVSEGSQNQETITENQGVNETVTENTSQQLEQSKTVKEVQQTAQENTEKIEQQEQAKKNSENVIEDESKVKTIDDIMNERLEQKGKNKLKENVNEVSKIEQEKTDQTIPSESKKQDDRSTNTNEGTSDVIQSSSSQSEIEEGTKKVVKNVVTNPTPTSEPDSSLRITYPQAWTPQFSVINLAPKGKNALMVQALDKEGNMIPHYESLAGKGSYNYIPITMLSPAQLNRLDDGTGEIVSLYYFEPRLDENNKVVIEGNRVITNQEKIVPWTTNVKGQQAQMVMVVHKHAKRADQIVNFQLANSHTVGVGTEVILRVEPNNIYKKSKDPNEVRITVRLASNPDVILSYMRGGNAKFKENLKLRDLVSKAMDNTRSMEIKAKITGKSPGFIINNKSKGVSVKNSLSLLESADFDLIIGYGMGSEVVVPNSSTEVAPSNYVEDGRIYLIMPAANGVMIPIRLETSTLGSVPGSIEAIINLISESSKTPSEKRSEVNKIVKVYAKVESEKDLSMDDFRVKFRVGQKIIGLQYNPEGGQLESNFQKAMAGKPFNYFEYNADGTVKHIEGAQEQVNKSGEKFVPTLRKSTELGASATAMKEAFALHLNNKKFNVQSHLLNTLEQYRSPINGVIYGSYLGYLSTPDLNIVTTDVNPGNAQKFNHSIIYVEITEDQFKPSSKEVPGFLEIKKDEIKQVTIDQIMDEKLVEQQEQNLVTLDDIMAQRSRQSQPGETKIEDINDIGLDELKLRERSIEDSVSLLSEAEINWFTEKFGTEGLKVLGNVKYIRLKDGREAWGYYKDGMAVVARGALAGTVYWEAFRRVMDIHLSPAEKKAILKEADDKYGYQWLIESEEEGGVGIDKATWTTQDLETALAKDFMNFMLDETDTSIKGRIKKFFKEILFYIKNLLGMESTIEKVFRNVRDTKYKNYTAKKLKMLSKGEPVKLRQKLAPNGLGVMKDEHVQELVGNINFVLYEAIQKKADQEGKSIDSYLRDTKFLTASYEGVRQLFESHGKKILSTPNISDNLKAQGRNYEIVSSKDMWYNTYDELNNLKSPGFFTLALKNLGEIAGAKFDVYRGKAIIEEIEENVTANIEENQIVDLVKEEDLQSQEKIHGLNFYYRPIKDTLSKAVKTGLKFIPSTKPGNLLGRRLFEPFDDVYNYLSLNLSNVPQGRVLEHLQTLVEKHEMVKHVLELYESKDKAWQNQFVSHFNKQNIQFKTLILEQGTVKVVYTNRNGIERQMINDWNANRLSSKIFVEKLGENDSINILEVQKIYGTAGSVYEQILKPTASKYQRITNIVEQKEGKKQYLVGMVRALESLGIVLPQETKKDLYEDDTVRVSDLHKYMMGSTSFEHVFKNLMRHISPYQQGNMEQGALGKLAKLIAKYKVDSYLASFIGGNRKNIYSINLNTFDSERTLELRHENTYEETINKYFKDVFYKPVTGKENIILKMLLQDQLVRDNFQLSTFDVVKEKGEYGRATEYDRMSENLSAITRFAMFFNSGSTWAEFSTGTKSDKSQFKFITLPKISEKNTSKGLWKTTNTGVKAYIDTAVELLKPLLLGEYARITRTWEQIDRLDQNKQIQNIHYKNEPGDGLGNGTKFMFFRMLNDPKYGLFDTSGRIKEWNKTETSTKEFSELSQALEQFLREYVKTQITNTIDSLVEAKAVTRVNSEIHNLNLPLQALKGRTLQKDITPAIVEFAVNDLVYRPYLFSIFNGDLAHYTADATGNPIINAGKRGYQTVTPGINFAYNEQQDYGVKGKFKHAILKDIFKEGDTQRLRSILLDAGVTEENATRISNAYKRINKTDAQGFTTLEFHKREMESRGMWLKEHEEAYNKYWKKGELGGKAEQKLLLDPMKTYYFGNTLVNDGVNEYMVFRQIKHSTIPLIPALTKLFDDATLNKEAFYEKSELTEAEKAMLIDQMTLEDLRQRMEGIGKYKGLEKIDMVNFESAVKVGANGVGTGSSVMALKGLNVETLETKYLRSPQIIETKSKNPLFGSQFAKILVSNIESKFNYKVFGESVKGNEIKLLYDEAWSEKIQRSHNKLINEIGWSQFKEIVDNMDTLSQEEIGRGQLKFLKKVRNHMFKMLEERDLPDNYYLALDIERLTDDINMYDFKTPLSFPVFAKRFESILLSMFKNNVLKQRTKGMAAVQVAEYGYNLSKELEIKKHANGGIYAEVALPYELAVKMNLKVGEVTQDSSIYDILGYRIPTQGKNSMLALKVVKILPPNVGATIILPAEITTIMGSDFDIDKMYLMFPELTKKGERESAFKIDKWRTNKNFQGLSDQAVNQVIFDIAESILTSKNSVEEILSPLDSGIYEEIIREYSELGIIEDINKYDIATISADMYLEKINKDANMLIGLFSLHSTGHAVSQDSEISLREGNEIHINIEGISKHTELNRIKTLDGKHLISDSIKDSQNESVDNANNQRIGRAGVTVYNHGVKVLLDRIGMPARVGIDFINQPLIREYQKERASAKIGESDLAIAKKVAAKFNVGIEFINALYKIEERIFTPTPEYLKNALTTNLAITENAEKQAQLLADFFNYQRIAKDLSKVNKYFSPETWKNFSRLSFLEEFKNIENYVKSDMSSIEVGNIPQRVQSYITYGIDSGVNLTNYFIPFMKEGFLELKRSIALKTGQESLMLNQENTETVNSLGMYWAFVQPSSPLAGLFYNKEMKGDLSLIKKRLFTLTEATYKNLLRIRSEKGLQNDPFLGLLYAHPQNNGKNNYIKLLAFNNTTKLSSAKRSQLTDRWEQLLDPNLTPDVEVRALATQLVAYSIITSGFMTGPNSFVDLIPNSYWSNKTKDSQSLVEFFRKEARTMEYSNYFGENAARQIIRNMFTDPGFLKTLDKTKLLQSENLMKTLELTKNQYYVHEDSVPELLFNPTAGSKQFVEYFKVYDGKWRLYEFRNRAANGAVYEEISPLGERYKFVEMISNDALHLSINPKNKTKHTIQIEDKLSEPSLKDSTNETLDNILGRLNTKYTTKKQTIEDLDNRLVGFLEKHFGVQKKSIDVLKNRLFKDSLGVADTIHKILYLNNNYDRYTIPEETAHFFIDYMENDALVQRLMNAATKTTVYGQVLNDYAGVYNTDMQFKKEAAGKILGQYIVQQYFKRKGMAGSLANEEFTREYRGILGLLQQIWDKIKSIFTNKTAAQELKRELNDLFGPLANQILSGDTSGIDLTKAGTGKYANIGSNAIDAVGRLGEGALNKIGKSLSILDFTNEELKKLKDSSKNYVQMKAGWNKAEYIKELLSDSERITSPTEDNNFYVKNGVNLTRVTSAIDMFTEAFATEEYAKKVAAFNKSKGNPFNTTEKVMNLWDFLREDVGTAVHKVMEGIIKGKTNSEIFNSLSVNSKTKSTLSKTLPIFRQWVENKTRAGSKLYAEVKVADMQHLIAGTIDVVEVTKNDRIIFHDFKTKMTGKLLEIEKRLPNFKFGLSAINNTLLNQYRIQLSLYKYIVERKGIKVDRLSIEALESNVKLDKNDNVYMEQISFANNISPTLQLESVKPIADRIINSMLKKLNPENINLRIDIVEKDKALVVLDKAKNVLEKKIEMHKRSGSATYQKSMQDLLKQLEEVSEKEGLVLFVKRAIKDIHAAKKKLRQLEKDDAVTAKNLKQIVDFVSAYDILDEVLLLAPTLSSSGLENVINKYVSPAIRERNEVQELYKALGRPIIAEFLTRFVTKPGMTEAKMRAELETASRDIGYLARWLDALGDSNDTALAMVDKHVSLQRNEVQEAEYNLVHGTKKSKGLREMMEMLESERSGIVNVNNYKKLFEPMLEKDAQGNLTGFIVGPLTYEYRMKRQEFIKEKREAGIALTGAVWNEFYRDNKVKEDPRYTAMMQLPETSAMKQFYNFFIDNYKYAQSLLPPHMRRGLALPSLRASAAEIALEGEAALGKRLKSAGTEALTDYLLIREDENEYGELVNEKGEPLDYVPVHYNRRIGNEEGQLSPENLSYNLYDSLRMYFTMAVNHNKMNEIIAELELTTELLKTRGVAKLKSGMPVLDPQGNKVTKEGIQSNAYNRLVDYMNMVVYGKRKKKGGDVMTIAGKKVPMDKIWDGLLQYGSLRVLALNQHAGLANIGFGHLMNWIEGFSEQHFGKKNVLQAEAIYAGALADGSIIKDVINRVPVSKLGLMNEYFNVLQHFDEHGRQTGYKNLGLRGLNSGALFFMMTAGEHMIQSKLFIAFAKRKKFKLSDGKSISLWDAYTVENGKLVVHPEVANQFNQHDRGVFKEKVQAVYQKLHGIYNVKDRAAIQQYAAGRWAMQFRKWTRPGFMRRFEGIEKFWYDKESEFRSPEWNERIQSYVEGNYITTLKFIGTMIQEVKSLKLYTLPEKWKELSDWQKANVKKSLGEVMGFATLQLLMMALLKAGDEDEEKSWAHWQTLYTLKRVDQELKFFSYLPETWNVLKTPAASMTSIEVVLEAIFGLLGDSMSLLFTGDVERYKRRTGIWEKGDPKIWKKLLKTLPFQQLFQDPKDKLKWFDLN